MQTEKAESSHLDRTRGDKNQIFPTLVCIEKPQKSFQEQTILSQNETKEAIQELVEKNNVLTSKVDSYILQADSKLDNVENLVQKHENLNTKIDNNIDVSKTRLDTFKSLIDSKTQVQNQIKIDVQQLKDTQSEIKNELTETSAKVNWACPVSTDSKYRLIEGTCYYFEATKMNYVSSVYLLLC